MRERQPLRMQPQPMHAEVGGHRAVQRPLAVRGVAQDGVGDVFQVAADLVVKLVDLQVSIMDLKEVVTAAAVDPVLDTGKAAAEVPTGTRAATTRTAAKSARSAVAASQDTRA